MRLRNAHTMSGPALMGLALGTAVGIAAGLLTAPMRGGDMRATIRRRAAEGRGRLDSFASSAGAWAHQSLDRGRQAFEEARHAYHEARNASPQRPLTAPLGESPTARAGAQSTNPEARS